MEFVTTDLVEIIRSVGSSVAYAWPFFLVSIVMSVLVRSLKLDGVIRRVFDNKIHVAIVLATLVGAFSPFCSCTVVPVIAGLLGSGVPLAPIMAFWIASPTMDPEIFALSVGILGWPMAVVRLGATLVLSLGAGYLTLALTRAAWLRSVLPLRSTVKAAERELACDSEGACSAQPALQPVMAMAVPLPVTAATSCQAGSCSLPDTATTTTTNDGKPIWRSQLESSFRDIRWPQFGREVLHESWNLGRWLLLAFALEALISLYVPQTAIASLLGENTHFAVPLAALVGVPLYLTNISALPIISALLAQGMQPGAAIAFLIAGPVTTLPAMTAVWGTVHRRIFYLYLAIGLGGAMTLGVVTNWILG